MTDTELLNLIESCIDNMKNKSNTLKSDIDNIIEEIDYRNIKSISTPSSTLEKWKDVSYVLSLEMPKYGY